MLKIANQDNTEYPIKTKWISVAMGKCKSYIYI